MDAFYVQTMDGKKVAEPRRVAALKASLMDVLEQSEAGAQGKGRKLERAPASVAR